MEKGVYGKVIEVAENKLNGKLNLVQYKAQKAKAMVHKSVCEQAVAFAKENPLMPFYAVLAMGINANANKVTEFEKGYKSFDSEKAKTCYEMAKMYTEKMGIKGKPSDTTWNLVSKFYNKKSHKLTDFALALENAKQMDDARGHFAELCQNLGM